MQPWWCAIFLVYMIDPSNGFGITDFAKTLAVEHGHTVIQEGTSYHIPDTTRQRRSTFFDEQLFDRYCGRNQSFSCDACEAQNGGNGWIATWREGVGRCCPKDKTCGNGVFSLSNANPEPQATGRGTAALSKRVKSDALRLDAKHSVPKLLKQWQSEYRCASSLGPCTPWR